jgi:Protein of unknown function (DUF2800)
MTQKRTPRIDLNPSSAERWTRCTASPKFIFDNWDKLPPHDTFYNQEGTTAHEVASALLQNREPDPANCPVPIDAEMNLHAWNYAEYVLGFLKPGGTLMVERKLPLFYMLERNAIIDAAVWNSKELHIIDFKYGEGITVDPFENLQEIIYARCVTYPEVPPPDDFPIFLHIYQPRSRDAGADPGKVWETTWGYIRQRGNQIAFLAREVLAKSPKYTPKFAPSDKACQWCPAKGFCDARRKELTKDIEVLAEITPAAKKFPPAASISLQQLQAILEHGAEIKKWIGDAEDYALQFMRGGGKIPGHKLVLSRGGNRYWSNPKEAAKLMLENTILKEGEVWEKKVIGPAAAEKLLGKQKFDARLTNLITKSPGVPVIAPIDDKREEYGVIAANEFEALDDVTLDDI